MLTRSLQFEVRHTPAPQPRQRFGVGVNALGKAVPVPMKDRKAKRAGIDGFKAAVQAAALLSRTGQWPLWDDGWGFRLLCVFKMPPPAGLPKTRTGFTVCPVKPDLDNMVKGVKDALNKILWPDDGAVFDEQAVKVYPPPGVEPGASVFVQAVPFRRREGVSEVGLDTLTGRWASLSQLFEGL